MSKPQRVGLIAESSSNKTSQQNRTRLMLPMSPGGKVWQREQKALSLLELGKVMKEWMRREKWFCVQETWEEKAESKSRIEGGGLVHPHLVDLYWQGHMHACRYLRKIETNSKSVIITLWFLWPSSEDFWRPSMPEECFSSALGSGLNLESRWRPVALLPFLKCWPDVKDFFAKRCFQLTSHNNEWPKPNWAS